MRIEAPQRIELQYNTIILIAIMLRRPAMKLNKIHIVNFRSIRDVEIITNPSCQIFIGINESGKSNLLKAISLLSPLRSIDKKDRRECRGDEEKNQTSYVEYQFEMDKKDMGINYEEIRPRIFTKDKFPTIALPEEALEIQAYYETHNQVSYICDINSGERVTKYATEEDACNIKLPGFVKKKESITVDSVLDTKGNPIQINDYYLFNSTNIEDSSKNLFEEATLEDLNGLYIKAVTDNLIRNLPHVVFWEYNNENVLPQSVPLQKFIESPDICVPLKEMFLLTGYTNISEVLSQVNEENDVGRFRSLLSKVSKSSTEYFNKVWKDYEKVSFDLQRNGENIDIYITEGENYYTCDVRSDGFKRFVTFLLLLSAKVENNEIKDAIIVIDEPDIGLHIKGQKNLVEELLKISGKNLVFYSTHSIFMIDYKRTDRHFIVRKEQEITTITQAGDSNYMDDEVLYNALGYSVFETLKATNIIFEGWSDKHVYDIALSADRTVPNNLKEVGTVHSSGTKDITPIAKCLELANRETYIISDSDQPAMEAKKRYEEDSKASAPWYMYTDLLPQLQINTLEDFIKHDTFLKYIQDLQDKYAIEEEFDTEGFVRKAVGRENYIKGWLEQCNSLQENVKDLTKELKERLYERLTVDDIEETYYEFLDELSRKIETAN